MAPQKIQTNNFSFKELIRSKTYCVHLFSQVATDPSGYLRPCCEFKSEEKIHISKTTPFDFFNSPYFQDLRKKVNSGEKLKGCSYCYSMEEINVESMRQRHNLHYFEIVKKVGNNIQQENIYSFDLRMGNLCNLGCVMCAPGTSSFLEKEQKKNPKENFIWDLPDCSDLTEWYKDPKIIQDIVKDTGNIKKLWLLGGEPLINMGNIKILEALKSRGKSLEIEVSSNITVLNEKILELLSRHNTIVKCSIDGIGAVCEYIRYPSVFKDIEKNFRRLFQTDIEIDIVFSVQILNILNIKAFYFWLKNICEEFSKPCCFWVGNIVIQPGYLAIRNLPKEIKVKAIGELKDILEDIKSSEKKYISSNPFSQLIDYLENEKGDVNKIKEGWKFIESFDRIRKNSWCDVVPWMKEVLNI